MPTAIDSSNSETAIVRRRSLASDKRRGRSRSPSAYLKKSGKSLRGFFGGKSDKKGKSSRNVKKALELDDLDAPPSPTPPPPPRVIPTTPPPPVSVSSIDASEEPKDMKIETDEQVSSPSDDANATSAGLITSDSPPPAPQDSTTATTDDASPPTTATTTTTQPEETNKAQTPGITTEGDKESVRVILLLMDPQSRRFELLQLEFDSAKAIVEDLLSQIPTSATEDTVRNMTYDGICTIDGVEMTCTRKLRDFVEGCDGVKSVVLAMPTGRTAEECVMLARPILSDPKVARMVDPEATPMVDEEVEDDDDDDIISSEPIVNNDSNNNDEDDNENTDNTNENTTDGNNDSDNVDDNVVTSPSPDEPTTPTPEEPPTPTALDNSPSVVPSSPAPTATPTPTPTPTENKSTDKSIASPKAAATMPKSTPKSIDDGSASTLSKITLFFALLLPILLKYQKSITNPLSPGDQLLPGDYRSRCGLKAVVPLAKWCEHEESRLHFDKEGTLTLYRGPSSEVVWQVDVNCDAVAKSEAEVDCRLIVEDDGSVVIQGQKVTFNKDMAEVSSPWPFVLDVPVTKGKKNKRGILGRNK